MVDFNDILLDPNQKLYLTLENRSREKDLCFEIAIILMLINI